MKVFVLTRAYSDWSSFTVLRVLATRARAEQDVEIVKGDTGMNYEIHEVELLDVDVVNQQTQETDQ